MCKVGMNKTGIYIVLFLGTSFNYSHFPQSHQFLLHCPMLALVRMLSSHLILTFAFAHTRPSTDQVLFLCGYRYISDPGTNFLCFIKTWCAVLLIYHFYNRLFPEGCGSWWWHCYDLWWNCWRKMYALFGSPSSDTWCLFPQLELLPFQVLFTIFWNAWVYLEGGSVR